MRTTSFERCRPGWKSLGTWLDSVNRPTAGSALEINVRVGVHRGLVYLDTPEDDVYGLAANLAARVSSLAPANAVVVSDAVEPLIRHAFETEALPAAPVKGVEGLINHFRVVDERAEASRARGPLVGRDRELARLQKSWARAQSGTLTTPGVVFRGEAGIGKSRLAAAAIEMVERDGGAVVELVGSPLQPDAGLHPVRMFLERRWASAGIRTPGSACGSSTLSSPPTGWIHRPRCHCLRRWLASPPSTAMTQCLLKAASCRS